MKDALDRHRIVASLLAILTVLAVVWSLKLFRLQRSVDTHAQFWSQPRGQAGGLLYVALGDSAAQGIGASSPQRGYVGLIADRFAEATGQPVQIVNLSRSGARIDDVLERQLPLLRQYQPDLITVGIGGNDIRRFDLATLTDRVARLMAALPAGAVVADAPYFMHGRWERDASAAANAMSEAARRRRLSVVPLHEALRAEGWSAMFTQFAADWFHPNDRGHRVWADAFWATILTTEVLTRSDAAGTG